LLGWEKYRRWTILLFLFSALGATPILAQDTITILQLGPFPGSGQDVGHRSLLGTQLGAEEINAAGGLLGENFILLPIYPTRSSLHSLQNLGKPRILLAAYSSNQSIIGVFLLIDRYGRKYDPPYLKQQIYLNPHPLELQLRNHV
jgi:hypothetical protein